MNSEPRRYQVWASIRVPAAVQDPGKLTQQELLRILEDIEQILKSVSTGHLPIPYALRLLKIEDAYPPQN